MEKYIVDELQIIATDSDTFVGGTIINNKTFGKEDLMSFSEALETRSANIDKTILQRRESKYRWAQDCTVREGDFTRFTKCGSTYVRVAVVEGGNMCSVEFKFTREEMDDPAPEWRFLNCSLFSSYKKKGNVFDDEVPSTIIEIINQEKLLETRNKWKII